MSHRYRQAVMRMPVLTVASTAAIVAAALLAGCAQRAPVGEATAAAEAGECHLIATPQAIVAPSDNSPAVSCTSRHDVEVLSTFTYTGRYVHRHDRPQPEQLSAELGDKCQQYWVLRSYLGAGALDDHWGVQVWARFPSPQEWADGVRTIRCDLVPDSGADGPFITTPLRNVLQRKASARFRLCYRGDTALSCDKPHDVEMLAGTPDLPAGPYPGAQAAKGEAVAVCTPLVEEYLGRSLSSTMAVKPRAPTAAAWRRGDRHVDCGVGPAQAGTTVTGTWRGGLR